MFDFTNFPTFLQYDLTDVEDLFDELPNFGLDFNMSVAKQDTRDYAVGMHIHCDAEGKEGVDVESYVESDSFTKAIDEIVDDVINNIKATQKDNDEETIISLQTDKVLLERRIQELTEKLQEERAQNKIARQYNEVISKWLGESVN